MSIKNFDKIVRPERKAILCGEEVDLTKIPTRVTLEMTRLSDNQSKLNSEEGFHATVELVAMACKPSNPKMTADWLIDNTDFETLMEFMDYALEPVKKRVEESEQEALKNMTAQVSKKK